MGINEITQSKSYKKVMGYIYGWGASVILIGALFKIEHLPGASAMLFVGLLTEAVIFFLSAFEPPHEEVDWSIVYPELVMSNDDMDFGANNESKVNSKKSALEKFDALIESAEITPELFEKLGGGLKNMSNTAEKLSDVSDATVATNNYVANFEKASNSVSEFADAYGKSASELNRSAEKLTNTYEDSANMVGNSGQTLADSYKKMTEAINSEYDRTTQSGSEYADEVSKMAKNLTALNAVYELQLKGTNEHLEASKKLYSGLDEIMSNLKDSADDTLQYRQQIGKLSHNLSAMNTIYGNMLSAMNVKIQD